MSKVYHVDKSALWDSVWGPAHLWWHVSVFKEVLFIFISYVYVYIYTYISNSRYTLCIWHIWYITNACKFTIEGFFLNSEGKKTFISEIRKKWFCWSKGIRSRGKSSWSKVHFLSILNLPLSYTAETWKDSKQIDTM
jgi:hypothetical protein